MKLAVTVILALAFAATIQAGGDKHELLLKKWVKAKAIESCFGEENFKKITLQMKRAKAKCLGKPAPELRLPLFVGKAKIVNSLSQTNAQIDTQTRKALVSKLVQKTLGEVAELEDEAPAKESESDAIATQVMFDDDKDDGGKRRWTRDTEEDGNGGGQIVARLKALEDTVEAEIGNMTCFLQEVGIINEENDIDVDAMDKNLNKLKWTKAETGINRTWLKAEMKKVHHRCKELADALPESVLDACSLPHWLTRLQHFHQCVKQNKCETCMKFDVRNKIADRGIPVPAMAKRAGLEEDELIKLAGMLYFKDF